MSIKQMIISMQVIELESGDGKASSATERWPANSNLIEMKLLNILEMMCLVYTERYWRILLKGIPTRN